MPIVKATISKRTRQREQFRISKAAQGGSVISMTDEHTEEQTQDHITDEPTQAMDMSELTVESVDESGEESTDLSDAESDEVVEEAEAVAVEPEITEPEATKPDLSWEAQKKVAPKSSGWTYPGVFILSGLAMAVIMGSDALITGEVGLISNVGLLVFSLIAASQVRSIDYMAAVWAPPIAWVFALCTGGQFGLTMSGSLLRKEIFHFAYGLANHAVWILGSVILAGAIAIVRHGRRS